MRSAQSIEYGKQQAEALGLIGGGPQRVSLGGHSGASDAAVKRIERRKPDRNRLVLRDQIIVSTQPGGGHNEQPMASATTGEDQMISRIARSLGDQVARCARRHCAATAKNYNIGVFSGLPDRRMAAS